MDDATQPVEAFVEEEDESQLWGRLIFLDGSAPIPLDSSKPEIVVGREGSGSDVEVAGTSISKKHLRIYRVLNEGECVMIEDLSVNGTYIDGKLLGTGKRTLLTHGAVITLGQAKSKLMFHQVTGSSNDIVPQTEYEKKYDTQQFVGRGNFSIVHLAIQKETGKKFAVKIIDKTKFMFQSKVLAALDREVEILAKVQPHVNIVGFEEAFDEGDKLRIVMELLPGGDLLKLLKTRGPLDEETVRGFFLQMVHVLKYLKTKGITHRDLKPDNFLVADGDVLKLADFGIAKGTSAGNALNTMCGTPAYLAPEVILGKPYDSRVDVYSIGVILFFLLSCGDTPYQNAQSEPELYQKVKNGDVDWSAPSWATVSPSAKDLIRQLMALDPAQRIKLEDIEAHAWFNRVYAHLVLQGEKQDIFELKSVITKIGRSGTSDIILTDLRISNNHCSISFADSKDRPTLTVTSKQKTRVNATLVTGPTKIRDGDMIELAPPNADRSAVIVQFKLGPSSLPVTVQGNKRKIDVDSSPTTIVADSTHSSTVPSSTTAPPTPIFKQPLPKKPRTVNTPGPSPAPSPSFDLEPKTKDFFMERKTNRVMGVITIGRLPECSIILDHQWISSMHCKIFQKEDKTVVVEDLSANGTWVNGVKVGKGKQHDLLEGDVVMVCKDKKNPIEFLFRKLS